MNKEELIEWLTKEIPELVDENYHSKAEILIEVLDKLGVKYIED